jgi:hypothetical protein
MPVRKYLSLLLIFTFLISYSINSVQAEDNLILRKILTDITWSKAEEGTRINLDYVVIKKVGDQETTFSPNIYFIDTTDLDYQQLTKVKDENYIEDSGSSSFVYKEDRGYGNFIEIFADVHKRQNLA